MSFLDDIRPVLPAWGAVLGAVREGFAGLGPGSPVQFAWQAFYQSYLARGVSPPRATIGQMDKLVGRAYEVIRAQRQLTADIAAFQRTGSDAAVWSAHIGRDIDARDPGTPGFVPLYRVRFESTFLRDNDLVTEWRTWAPGMVLPQTIAELMDGLDQAGEATLIESPPETGTLQFLQPTGQVSITVI